MDTFRSQKKCPTYESVKLGEFHCLYYFYHCSSCNTCDASMIKDKIFYLYLKVSNSHSYSDVSYSRSVSVVDFMHIQKQL